MTPGPPASSDGSSIIAPAHGPLAVAETLMRMALALLDQGDQLLPAARLQHAIDTLAERRVSCSDEAWGKLTDPS